MKYLLVICLLVALIVQGQTTRNEQSKTTSINYEKWKKAVVNLECRIEMGDNIDSQRTRPTLKENMQTLKQFTGTAIFLESNGKRYLLTNRHVLYDADMVAQKKKYHQEDSLNDPFTIFMRIFRIPTESEIADTTLAESGLFIMGAPGYASSNYVFSSQEIDLAIISIDGSPLYSIFGDLLKARGYEPIHLSDIDTSSLKYGQDLSCIGYPMISLLGNRILPEQIAPWYSDLIAESIYTFGRVSLPNYKRIFFIGDMTIAPGNSGGLVISNNKMVGIVSAQATIPIDKYPEVRIRFPYSFAIKASYLFPLLQEMIDKDNRNGKRNRN